MQGHTVSVAINGQLGVDRVVESLDQCGGKHTEFDLVLMDCDMPVMDGLQVIICHEQALVSLKTNQNVDAGVGRTFAVIIEGG